VPAEGAGQAATPARSGGRLPAGEIKGQMTLSEIAEQCQVPLTYLLEQMKLAPNEDPNQTVKAVADKYGFEVGALRIVVSDYQTAHP
jgi:hypothetical protein